ncbi:MAG: radical SAM protein [Planctomycetota bacterium]
MKIELILPPHRPLERPRARSIAPPYNLALLAAHTPAEHSVRITDGYVQRVDFSRKPDLVGITALTASASGAIHVARRWRAQKVPVVMGGLHASALPEEMLNECDAVLVGEAEGVWPRLLADFAAGRLQEIYRSESHPSLAGLPFPRRDLLNPHRYFAFNLVETSRGCPFHCIYCSDSAIFGDRYRYRPVEEVVEEIRSLARRRFVVFIDNNIVGSLSRAKALFGALIPLRIKWVAQASITMAYDDELLDLAARSGCMGVLIGLETLKPDVLRRIGKGVDPARYVELIRRIQGRGIFVQGEFIFGFDEDTPDVFRETLDFVNRAKLASARFAILKPYPGTELYRRWLAQGRIRKSDWSDWNVRVVPYEPAGMSAEALAAGRDWAYRTASSPSSIFHRVGLSRKHAPLLWAMNVANCLFRNSRFL